VPTVLPYAESFAILKNRVEITGDPHPTVNRPPKHDDERPGPSIFRTVVEEVDLTNLTLPGLYVGRSELRDVTFQGSDLHMSTFNWSDLTQCRFMAADLTDADLRACRFVRCAFSSANLSRADLRGSTFADCVFDGAVFEGTKLYRRPGLAGFFRAGSDQRSLPLTHEQSDAAEWLKDSPEPGGG
jgi:hypothetical protein